MARYTAPSFLPTGFLGAKKIASELKKIEDAIELLLSRVGDVPNQMEADLDMNAHRIYNLPDALSLSEPVTLRQFLAGGGGGGGGGGVGAAYFNDLLDVTITSPAAGQHITFDGTVWRNTNPGIDTLGDVQITTPLVGDTLQWDGAKFINAPQSGGGGGGESTITNVYTYTTGTATANQTTITVPTYVLGKNALLVMINGVVQRPSLDYTETTTTSITLTTGMENGDAFHVVVGTPAGSALAYIHVGTTPPASPAINQLWVDTN